MFIRERPRTEELTVPEHLAVVLMILALFGLAMMLLH